MAVPEYTCWRQLISKNMTVGSKVLKIDLENKKVSQVLDMDTLLKSVYARAKKKGNAKNWISLDSIQCTGTNQLLLSSSKLSSVFKVSRVGSLLPSVDYIIADASQWKSYKGLKKKVLTKTLADGKDPDANADTGYSIYFTDAQACRAVPFPLWTKQYCIYEGIRRGFLSAGIIK